MSRIGFFVAILLVATALVACGDDGGSAASFCDLGNEITADFDSFDNSETPPSAEDLQAVADKVDDLDPPDEIADAVDTIKENFDDLIEAFENNDFAALQEIGPEFEAAGAEIEAYLAENC